MKSPRSADAVADGDETHSKFSEKDLRIETGLQIISPDSAHVLWAAVVQRIFQLTIEGHGPYEIATMLCEEKVETPATYFARQGRGVWASFSASGPAPRSPYPRWPRGYLQKSAIPPGRGQRLACPSEGTGGVRSPSGAGGERFEAQAEQGQAAL